MNIAVNTRLLIKSKLEGIGWFTYESLRRITAQHPEHHFYFIFDRDYNEEFIFSDNITPIVVAPQARHPLLFYIWFEIQLPGLLKRLNPDLFLSPDGYLSLRSDVRSLAVFHDLNFEHYPENIPLLSRMHYRHYFPKYARKAVRIATVSKFSKEDICKQYGVSGDKIDIVYDGANEDLTPLTDAGQEKIRNRYSQGCPYFIFVGSLHPRKNLVNLFKAFDLFKKETSSDVKLLIVGAKKWWTKEIRETFEKMEFAGEVLFSGRLDAGELGKALGSAIALTYVSYFEGFGIPIVEAFRCGTPVITSNVTSMPEIAGDAALLVDPFQPSSIAGAMADIYKNEGTRQRLILAGEGRKDEFTWQKTADHLWASIEKAVKSV
jgi:glycosyltransferase involved in cell wall biosynthesis